MIRGVQLERRNSSFFASSKPKSTTSNTSGQSSRRPKETPALPGPLQHFAADEDLEDQLERLLASHVSAEFVDADRVAAIREIIELIPVPDPQSVLEFCDTLIHSTDIQVANQGYTIIEAISKHEEFKAYSRVEFYLRVVQRDPPLHYQFHRSYLFSFLTLGGRHYVEAFVGLLSSLIPQLYSESTRSSTASDLYQAKAKELQVTIMDSIDVISNVIRIHSTLLSEADVQNLIEQIHVERAETCSEKYAKVLNLVDDIIARAGGDIPVESTHVLSKLLSYWVRTSYIRSTRVDKSQSYRDTHAANVEKSWDTFTRLLSTHMRDATMRGLLELLPNDDDHYMGAAYLLCRSMIDPQTRRSINVELPTVLEALGVDLPPTNRMQHACARLKLIHDLLSDEDMQLVIAAEPDWSQLHDAILICTTAAPDSESSARSVPISQQTPSDNNSTLEEAIDERSRLTSLIIDQLSNLPKKEFERRASTNVHPTSIYDGDSHNSTDTDANMPDDTKQAARPGTIPTPLLSQARFLRKIALASALLLSDDNVARVIAAYGPSAFRIAVGDWLEEIQELSKLFVSRADAPLKHRQQALRVINEALKKAQELGEPDALRVCGSIILDTLEVEKEHFFRNNLVYCVISFVSEHLISITSDADFEKVIKVIFKAAKTEKPLLAAYLTRVEDHGFPSMLPDAGLVLLLMRTSMTHPQRARMIYRNILELVSSRNADREAAATVMLMRGLFRIRSDIEHHIFFVASPEGERLATILDRNANHPKFDRRSSLITGVPPPRTWSYGDITGLPEDPPTSISEVLRSDTPANLQDDKTSAEISIEEFQEESENGEDEETDGAYSEDNDAIDTFIRIEDTEDDHDPWEQAQTGILWPIENEDDAEDNEPFPESEDLRSPPRLPDHDNFKGLETTLDNHLDMQEWLRIVTNIIEAGQQWDWEVYSYIIVHLGSQLTNQSLFTECIGQIRSLASTICFKIQTQTCMKPPDSSNLKQADVVFCLIEILTTIIGYHWQMERSETENMISTFIFGLTHWNTTAVPCIHALTLCCYELPISLQRDLVRIVDTMKNIVTKTEPAIHVLEFLTGMSRLDLASRFHGDEIKVVFGVCTSYIDYARGKRYDETQQRAGGRLTNPARQGPLANSQRPSTDDIPQYVFAISYHCITFWFLTLKEEDQKGCLAYLEARLLSKDLAGNVEDEALVTLDHLWRMTEGRSMDSPSASSVMPDDSATKSWVSEYCILTVSYKEGDAYAEVVERRCSGTDFRQVVVEAGTATTPEDVFRAHLSSSMDGPFSSTSPPTPLSVVDRMKSSVSMFDRTSAIDFLKCGVIYVGESQTKETEILSNVSGSPDYNVLVSRLGTPVTLKGHRGNIAGLDTSEGEFDGRITYQHSDGVTTLNYHITTLMPTDRANDPNCIRKKSHIGNDYVNIVFNNSGLVSGFNFHTFPSDFNYVYVVVTPEARQTFIQTRTRSRDDPNWFDKSWFRVQVMTREDFPDISSAAEAKVVSGAALAAYVRNLTLNAEVFCRVWTSRGSGEYPSSWRSRLQQIRTIKERAEKAERERVERGE